ncbi:AraC family transcriptional regulator [Phytohabitans sp. ZYX-F-186]|uniref:AraC family transcriptional regulator n=1 Tax=Phytohabitans maris TaxID=3071409 RepID=A0ABU0ZJ83_9ACTN|nr:AraC family transcriptional regulator [Phytohabitans sp. ZYX-F-186]MDQ7906007.1 AraC family transcriptional regulator [Phytohabitans sp. ZYX-F-186]
MGDWARYWRAADRPLEAMHAHFEQHVYHRHSHETYSFGVTETGVQSFTCRGAAHTSSAGMVMAFNPDEPHDGQAADALGFTYRMVHIGPDLVRDVLADRAEREVGLPLFAEPVVADTRLAGAVAGLHAALVGPATALARDERLAAAVAAITRHGRSARPPRRTAAAGIARRVRDRLEEGYAEDVTAGDLAAAAGTSRFAVYRAFRQVYGLSPSDYQRQVRLRRARQLIGAGSGIAEAAAASGFADQSHLTRWFTRCYGVTPGAYRHALHPSTVREPSSRTRP